MAAQGLKASKAPKVVGPRFRPGDYTFEDFVCLVPDGQKADLLDGVIYMASPDNLRNNELNAWLLSVLSGFVAETDQGKVYVSRVAYRITEKRGPEPDLSFVAKEHFGLLTPGHVAGPPDVAVEIVSPDSVDRDYVLKREIYEEAGVREYWILDPDEKRATFLRIKRGRYQEVAPVKHVFRSEAIKGFWLDVRWLWTERRPAAHRVVQKLLGAGA